MSGEIKMTPGWEENLVEPIRDMLLQVGGMVQDDAADYAPVDSGELRDSLFLEVVNDNEVIVGASAPYAAHVELGTSRMAAQPYLQPALFKTRSL